MSDFITTAAILVWLIWVIACMLVALDLGQERRHPLVRIQVSRREWAILRALAKRRGVSVSEVIRPALDDVISTADDAA